MPLQRPRLGDTPGSVGCALHGGVSGCPGTPRTCWLVTPLTHMPQPFSRQQGHGSAAPRPGGRGEVQRPPARCGKRLLPSSALRIPPLSPSPRRQLRALLRRRSGKRGKRVTQAATNVLSATKPGLPLLRLLHPSDAPAPACSTAACKPARRRPPQLTAALEKHHAVSARPPAPL